MYLSLKGSLGHTPITGGVGENLLQIAEGASAAYSLRNLGSGSPAVVRVRRESDNNERDFTAQDISTSVLTNWVNEQITPPLDLRELTATGRDGPIIEAAAAYSLRNLSDSYTGSVVDVRRNTDGNTQPFTAAEVADGTLEDWVLGDAASLVGDAQYFNGTDSKVALDSEVSMVGDFTVSGSFLFSGSLSATRPLTGVTAGNSRIGVTTGTGIVFIQIEGNVYSFTSLVIPANDKTLRTFSVTRLGTTTTMIISGIGTQAVTTSADTFLVGLIGRNGTGAQVWEGIVYDINLNNQAAYTGLSPTLFNDTIGSNNGTPSNLVTFTGQGLDGTVSKWYDQSTTSGVPNANHAVQTDAVSQPKIVSGGSLLLKGANSEPSISFGTTADKHLDVTGRPVTKSVFSTLQSGDTNFETLICDTGDSSPRITTNNAANNRDYKFLGFGTPSVNVNGVTYDGTSSVFSFGFHLLGMTSGTGSEINRIGANSSTGATGDSFDFVSELILYPDDQTDNRTALEANIGEVYGIAGIPAYEDTVNGFVETWYDQSGNGKDATQLTAGNQPKIVDAGALVTTNGSPTIDFYDTCFLSTDAFLDGSAHSSFAAINNQGAISTRKIFYGKSEFPNKGFTWNYRGDQSAGLYDLVSYNGIVNPLTFSNSTSPLHFVSSLLINSTKEVFINGTSAATGSESFVADDGTLVMGSIAYGTGFDVQEIIIYPSDQSANRPAIEANINNQYDIY